MNLDSYFKTLFESILRLRDNLKIPKALNFIIEQNIIDIITNFNILNNFISNNRINLNLDKFKEAYLGELYIIHDITVGKFARAYSTRDVIDKFRSIHDRLFQNNLRLYNLDAKFRTIPTKLFSEFCKGITYFSDEVVGSPIYHRNSSCENSTITKSINFTCEKNKKKQYVKRCYLERLIFDKIYAEILHEQNIEHYVELKRVERIFQDTWPNESIQINLSYKSYLYPINMLITYDNGQTITRETYRRTYTNNQYVSNISCKQIKDGKVYEKTQTFDSETSWILQ